MVLCQRNLPTNSLIISSKKRAIEPVKREHIPKKYMKNRLRSSMFQKEKLDGNNKFEKLKSRLVADGSMQDKTIYIDLKSPTAKLDSIFIVLSSVSTKRVYWGKVDIGGAYLNAFLVDGEVIIMIISKQLTKILVKLNPELKEYVDEETGTMLSLIHI